MNVEVQAAAAVPRPAATLVVTRLRESRDTGLEILMLERSARADFVPGMFVFPGGGVEPGDLAPEAGSIAPALPLAEALRRVPDADSAALALGSFIAAIRETFEEAEILLARTASGKPAAPTPVQLEAGRAACRTGAQAFGEWVAAQGWTLAVDDLIYFAHWITPRAVPKRFDTRFFLTEAPPGAQVRTDQGEIVGHRWATPQDAVAAHLAGRMPMIEPTLHNLLLLKEFGSPAQARQALLNRPVRAIVPQLAVLPDGRRKVVLPWDPGVRCGPRTGVIRIISVPNLMLLPRSASLRRFVALCALTLVLLSTASALVRAQSQPNFKPLERGDMTEEEQKLLVIRGIEVGGDYAMRLSQSKDKDLTNLDNGTLMNQDFRLHLDTVFNQDVSMKLTLQTSTTSLDPTNLHGTPVDNRGREANGLSLQLVAREAYLQYRFNPNSAINIGQFDLSLGDHNGKVFRAIASGIDFDCRVGTWCMPFGATKVGQGGADWIYHWALRYNDHDDPAENGRRSFSAEIFRIIYTESNIPLGGNLGPATYNPSSATTATRVQLTDDCAAAGCGTSTGNPIYFDATQYNYIGLNVDWQVSSFFLTFDLTNAQGTRAYHLFRDPSTGIASAPTTATGQGPVITSEAVDGYATEVNLGFRWAPGKKGQLGFRYMTASGDENSLQVNANGQYVSPSGSAWQHGLTGYYEITPGTYRGTRLYFNGSDLDVDLGGGLGHSVNNKQVYGVYLDYGDPEVTHLSYSAGLYQINLNNSILNAAGSPVNNVGLEMDNMLTWNFHPRMALQFEVNLLESGGAMSFDDYTPPPATMQLFVQTLARLVYHF